MYFLFYLLFAGLKITPKVDELYSLFSPAVDENGRSHRINFYDDYVIKTFADDKTYVQLGYEGPYSSAGLSTKNTLPTSNFRIDFKIQITPSDVPGDGMSFWFTTDQFESGKAFGRKDEYNGIQIQLNTQQKNPCMKLIIQGHENVVNLKSTIYNASSTLRVENLNDVLKVYLSFKDQEFHELFSVTNPGVGQGYYYSVSASNSNGYNVCRIFGIRTSTLELMGGREEAERKSSKFVWFIFIVAVAVIGYILFKKQSKPMNRRA